MLTLHSSHCHLAVESTGVCSSFCEAKYWKILFAQPHVEAINTASHLKHMSVIQEYWRTVCCHNTSARLLALPLWTLVNLAEDDWIEDEPQYLWLNDHTEITANYASFIKRERSRAYSTHCTQTLYAHVAGVAHRRRIVFLVKCHKNTASSFCP